jgi:hypothetical protein
MSHACIFSYNSLPLTERFYDCLGALEVGAYAQQKQIACHISLLNGKLGLATKPLPSTLTNQEIVSVVTKLFDDSLMQVEPPFISKEDVSKLWEFIKQLIKNPSFPRNLEARFLQAYIFEQDALKYAPSAPTTHSFQAKQILNKRKESKEEKKHLISCLKMLYKMPEFVLNIRKSIKLIQQRAESYLKVAQLKFVRIDSEHNVQFHFCSTCSDIPDIRIITYIARLYWQWMNNIASLDENNNEFRKLLRTIAHSNCSREVKTFCYTMIDIVRIEKCIHLIPQKLLLTRPGKTEFSAVTCDNSLATHGQVISCAIRISALVSIYETLERALRTSDTEELFQFRVNKTGGFLHAIQKLVDSYVKVSEDAVVICDQIATKKIDASKIKFYSKASLLDAQQELTRSPEGICCAEELAASSICKDGKEKSLVQSIKQLQITIQPPTSSIAIDLRSSNVTVEPSIASGENSLAAGEVDELKPIAHGTTFKYHKRVARWWSQDAHVNPFLNDTRYTHCLPDTQIRICTEHAFSLAVDSYVNKEGFRNNNQVTLIGELIMSDGLARRGVFGYAFDSHGICYHRHFTEKTPDDLCNEILHQGYYQLDFPPLPSSEQQNAPDVVVSCSDGSYVESETDELVVIKNPQDQTTIRLCLFSKTE